MSTAPTLRDLQHELERLLALGGDPDFRDELTHAAGRLPIAQDERLAASERLAIYTRMIFVRIRDAIAEDFPATYAALGDDAWETRIAAYLAAYPTDHPDLRLAARSLPKFFRETESSPLADLADLEWALADSFTARDASPLRAEALQSLAPEEWPRLRMMPVPSLRRLHANSAADANRKALLAGEALALEPTEPHRFRVWRRDFRVFVKKIDALESAALEAITPELSFADLCTWIAQREPDADPAQTAVALLQTWLRDEVLAEPDQGVRETPERNEP